MCHSSPLVSIGVPTYNRAEGLRTTLECVFSQTYKNFEVIVSDNCSPPHVKDEIYKIIGEFGREGETIRFFEQPHNIGAAKNFQFVARQAQGSFFAWVADDDMILPSFIETCVGSFVDASQECVAIGTEAQYYNGNKDYPFFAEGMAWYKEFTSLPIDRMLYAVENSYGNMFYSVYKTSFVQKEIVLSSLLTTTGNEIPFFLALSFFGSRLILRDVLLKKQQPTPEIVDFAKWQAEGGYWGWHNHFKTLRNFNELVRYMKQLRKEVLAVVGELKVLAPYLVDTQRIYSAFSRLNRKFLLESMIGFKQPK